MKKKVEETNVEEIEIDIEDDREDIADQNDIEDEIDDIQDDTDAADQDSEQDEQADKDDSESEEEEGDTEEELVVSIGDEDAPPQDQLTKDTPQWVKDTREKNRKLTRMVKELEEKLASFQKPETSISNDPGEKPTFEGCKFDDELYETELGKWYERKRQFDDQEEKRRQAEATQQQDWLTYVEKYNTEKKKLKVSDFAEAEETVKDGLSVAQQAIIIKLMDDPALVTYALGKNPKKLDEISKIQDLPMFIAKVSKLETQLKTTVKSKRPEVKPEKIMRGSSGPVGKTSRILEKLREEAAITGDYTKVVEYKHKLKEGK